ncbi:hypothetical protein EVAR_25287_1 [Eumeta japonica]|uniref:Uncharacterized protein n=1 Tax=Eumeta variegata TaxID=151549 RepID=A0A4C1VRJ7_EUMVA|nr:hypothetical protein EVAR_25287_1 [Eumeta japonica]
MLLDVVPYTVVNKVLQATAAAQTKSRICRLGKPCPERWGKSLEDSLVVVGIQRGAVKLDGLTHYLTDSVAANGAANTVTHFNAHVTRARFITRRL